MGRAADLEWLQFGERRTVFDRHGKPREVGAYALHLQCAWRITGPSGIVVGSRDLFYAPGGDPYNEPPDFDWAQPGANRRDHRTAGLIAEMAVSPLRVESVHGDAVGGFRLVLSDGYTLEVFPDDSLPAEHWRLFQPSTEAEHFVVTGDGIET